MARKGIRRDQVNPMNTVLYGAAAGYAVSLGFHNVILSFTGPPALGGYIPYRYDQVTHANRRFLTFDWSKIYLYIRLCSKSVAGRRRWRIYKRTRAYPYPVCSMPRSIEDYFHLFNNQVAIRKWRDIPWFRNG